MTVPRQNETAFGGSHGDFTERIRHAQGLARKGDTAGAQWEYEAILSNQPTAFSAAVGLAKILDSNGDLAGAQETITRSIRSAATHSNILTAARLWEAWQDRPMPGARVLRTAFTGVGTLDPLASHFRIGCTQLGIHPAIFVGEFNQWGQELLDPRSALFAFGPDLIFIDIDAKSLFPKSSSAGMFSDEQLLDDRNRGISQLRELLKSAQLHAPKATLVVNSWSMPDYSPLGILDMKLESGQRRRFGLIWDETAKFIASEFPRVVLLDKERMEARHGKARVRDDRLWYMASAPYSESFLPVITSEYLRVVRPLVGFVKKCIVLDLDNTLWGGVIGEDGINQIKLGGSAAPGNAFYDFQAALLALNDRGILLAVCSKNNPDDAFDAIDNHPYMLLRRKNFAATRINWQDKATNLVEIARELNIGLDSLVFLDDNPAERGLVTQQLPEVLTVELPRDPSGYVRTLAELDVFEALALTDEDQRRAAQYQEQQERKQFEDSASGDVHSYLRGLEIKVVVEPANPFTIPRITQLTNKTNQFNVTTRRYSEAQIQAMVDDPAHWSVCSVSVSDKFGDSGLTGVAIVQKDGDRWSIDSFLLSCRVLGRGIEATLMKYLMDQADVAGARTLLGTFVSTAKNAPAEKLFADNGFELTEQNEDTQHWSVNVADAKSGSVYPDWLNIETK